MVIVINFDEIHVGDSNPTINYEKRLLGTTKSVSAIRN